MTLEEVTTLKEAIKRLKEVIKEVRSTIQPFLYDNEAKDYILKALEQPKWIPVSEKLPKDSGEYLVSVTDKEDEGYKQVGVAWFAHPKDYDMKDGEWRELMIDEVVIAWMPLPEPYKEESEEK